MFTEQDRTGSSVIQVKIGEFIGKLRDSGLQYDEVGKCYGFLPSVTMAVEHHQLHELSGRPVKGEDLTISLNCQGNYERIHLRYVEKNPSKSYCTIFRFVEESFQEGDEPLFFRLLRRLQRDKMRTITDTNKVLGRVDELIAVLGTHN